MGNTITTLRSGSYHFLPQSSGRLNRPFTAIVPDGTTYGCTAMGVTGVVLLALPDANTLWVECLAAATSDPATWIYTASKSVFTR